MPKLRVIIKPPPEPQGEPEQQVEALRDYLLQMSEELAYVLTHLEADNINDSTFERIQGMIPRPYTGLPVMDGDASAGQSEQWARGDHRHGHDSTKADATALATETAAREAHEADTGNPHEVTKAQVGLSNVANERQYSAQNPPPTPSAADVGAIPTTEKGTAGGVAELDSNGMVPSAQLPSYVDDVLEYASLSAFPVTGESGKIYVALDTGRTYRWSGSAYVEISESLALGETSSTAYRGDRGKTAYDHSQTTSGNPHNVSASDVGLGNVANERQYSALNPPPLPTPADIGAATAQDLTDHVGDTANPHNVTAAQAGARPDTWMPTAADVGARADTWMPTASDVGARPDTWTPTAADVGARPDTWTPTASDVGARPDDWVPDAEDVPYDNTQSGLMATDVQAAIDEIAQGGGGGGTAASAVSYDNTGSGLTATNVQDAIDEVYGDIPTQPSDIGAQEEITASGILMGDGAGGVSAATAGTDYQAPLTIDATPTANSTNPVQSGGVYTDVRTRVPNYGKGQNIFRNWNFVGGGTGRGVFPVNQRGQSSYSGATFVFDGWTADANASITFGSAGITVSILSGSSTNIYQRAGKAPLGQSITMSILTGNGLVSVSGVMPSTLPSSNQTVLTVGTSTDGYRFRLYLQPAGTMYVEFRAYSTQTWVAAKLELGSEQTLAHQENGTWVLNEIPDYEYELYRCITSTADSSDTYANKSLATEQQLAYVETGTTTSRAYSVGEYFCWNGLLYRVTTAISSGGTFTPGTNCVPDYATGKSVPLSLASQSNYAVNSISLFEFSGMLIGYAEIRVISPATTTIGTIPSNFTPSATRGVYLFNIDGSTAVIQINSSGNVIALGGTAGKTYTGAVILPI